MALAHDRAKYGFFVDRERTQHPPRRPCRRGSMPVRRGRVTTIAVSIMIDWHLVADLEMGITLGVLAWLLWPGKAA